MRRRVPLLALIGAEAISAVGRAMTVIAIPWFVLQTTGSGAKTGVVAAAEAIGLLVSVALSGPWVDRYGARRCSALTDLGTALAVAGIPLAYMTTGLSLAALTVLAFAIGAARSPARTAKQVLLPDVLQAAHMRLERGTSVQDGVLNLGNLLGAPLGGLLIAVLGPPRVLLIDAASLVAASLLVAVLVRTAESANKQAQPGGSARRGYLTELREGLRGLRADRLLLTLAGATALVNALFGGLFGVLVPAYGARVWHSSTLVGLVSAALGAGSVLGTVLYGWRGHRLRRWPTFSVCYLLFAAPICVVLGLNPPPAVLVPLILVFGLGFGPLNPLVAAVKYDRVPVELRGRVFGALAAVTLAVQPLGLLLAGFLLDVIGVTSAVFVIGAVAFVVTVCPLIFPVWRELDAPPKVDRITA